MSVEQIQQGVNKIFEKHRIVFWYDHERRLRSVFEQLDLLDIEKVEISNNEFRLKYRLLREQPTQKFLLYHDGPAPTEIDNWLLDVLLASGEFRTDQTSIWLAEIGLGFEFAELVQEHSAFFESPERVQLLSKNLRSDDAARSILMKMLGVCCESEPRLEEIMEALFFELSNDSCERMQLIEYCGLKGFLWENVRRAYGYNAPTPRLRDFALQLFKDCYAMTVEPEAATLSQDALVFLKRWKDNRRCEGSFRKLSEDFARLLNIAEDLQTRDFRKLIDIDYFRAIDNEIVSALIRHISERTITPGDCQVIAKRRRQSHWYAEFDDLYFSADYAAQFMQALSSVSFEIASLQQGVESYRTTWFKIDQLYRKFIYHVQRAGESSLLHKLVNSVENLYSNVYLTTVNDTWQKVLDRSDRWDVPGIPQQRNFFKTFVAPFLDKGKKITVIISDALRYEAGEELLSRIRREDRFEANIETAVSMLPSYTQLGMAALLPNQTLRVAEDTSASAYVDGLSATGTDNRTKILANATNQRAKAVKAEHLLALHKDDCRALLRDHDVVYVYHNQIDAVGDKRDTEDKVFQAVESSIEELIKIVKKLTSANATNLVVTADHGFLYQHRPIQDSDFTTTTPTGSQILYEHRRFVIGKGLEQNTSFKTFSSGQLGLEGDLEVQLPKSICRLRQRGSGSRFVHGGASLQEVVIPVVQISKKRQSDISHVDVEIFKGPNTLISASQLSVVLYQVTPTTDKIQPRTLRAGIYTSAGILISDSCEHKFDLISENAREREIPIQFILTKQADEVNGQEVTLRLEELIPDTNQYQLYKTAKYTVRRAFTSDFEL